MIVDGDVRLQPTDDGGNIEIVVGQPVMDQGLETAVYISLFSGDWWGNAISERNEKLESEFEELYERSITNQTRLDAEEYIRAALEWMKRAGIAQKIEVTAYLPEIGWIGFVVRITQPGSSVQELRYQINWAQQRALMEA